MARKKDYLNDPEKYSADELVQAIENGIVSLQELQNTGLLSITKRYTINEMLVAHKSRTGSQPISDTDDPTPIIFETSGNTPIRIGKRNRRQGLDPIIDKNILKYMIIGLVVIAVCVGGYFFIKKHSVWSPEKIYSYYKKSVVLIATGYHFRATVDGQDLSVRLNDPSFAQMSWSNGNINLNAFCVGTGTGFFVSKEGKIVTCNHVVSDYEHYCDSIEYRLRDAFRNKQNEANMVATAAALLYGADISTNEWSYMADHVKVEMVVDFVRVALNDTRVQDLDDMLPCSIIKTSKDDDIDVAIVQLNTKTTPADVINIVDIPSSMKKDHTSKIDFKNGTDIYSIGFPLSLTVGQTDIGIEACNQEGKVIQDCGEYTYGHNINVHHGASGSPVFDNKGRFAGMVNAGITINGSAQGYNKAILPEHIARLLNY